MKGGGGGDAGPVVGGGTPERKIFVRGERSGQGECRERFCDTQEERETDAAESDALARRRSMLFVVRQDWEVRFRCELHFGNDCRFSDFGEWPTGKTHRLGERPGCNGSEQRAPGGAARPLD